MIFLVFFFFKAYHVASGISVPQPYWTQALGSESVEY